MSVSIRLSLHGKRGQPIYRIITCETRSKRNGKFSDNLGYYDPNQKPPVLIIDRQKLSAWQAKGAILSSGVRKILAEK